MKDVFEEIALLPGVSGSCLFSRTEGKVCSEQNALFDEKTTQEVAHQCTRLLQMGRMAGLAPQVLALRFDAFTLLAMPLDEDTTLLTVCETESNCSLVATTISMLAGELKSRLLQSCDKRQTSAVSTPQPPAPDETLPPLLEEIGEALAFAIGPVASLVLEEYVARWREKGPAVKSRLAELVTMLEDEIDDERQGDEFRKKMASLEPRFREE